MLDGGQLYTVSISDYGSNYFDHWQDSDSSARQQTVTASGLSVMSLIAVYRNTPLPPPPPGQSALTVTSVDPSGNAITGLYTTLSQNGGLISTDFTASAFMLSDSQPYVVAVSNYGQFVFSHWEDTGNTSSSREVTTLSSATDLVAVYNIITP
jgi:hypothetical protein